MRRGGDSPKSLTHQPASVRWPETIRDTRLLAVDRNAFMPTISQVELDDLNRSLEECSPQDLLRWAKQVFGDRLAALSAMQMSGSVICHMLHSLKLDVPIVFVDTGVMYAETLETRDRIAHDYGLKFITLHPELTMAEQTAKYGVLYLTLEGQKQCCGMRKVDPLQAERGRWDGLIGSLRRAEGGKRGGVPIVAIDTEMQAIRVNVLANVSDEQLDAYIREHQVIINPLHEQGFTTIGCNRCTTPVLPSEPPRAGRWRHLGLWSAYCQINPTDRVVEEVPQIELPNEVLDRLLGREVDFSI